MANSFLYTVATAVAVIISLITYLAAFVFAFKNRSKSSQAANYVLAGLGILCFSWLLRTFGLAAIAQGTTPANMAVASILMSVLNSVIFAVALGFFVAAAFVDRAPRTAVNEEFLDGDSRKPKSDSNPFAAHAVGDE